MKVVIKLYDYNKAEDIEKQNRIDEKIEYLSKFPFNLENGPLLRVSVINKDNYEHLLIFNIHHIIADGWSTAVLIQEFSEYYNSFANDTEINLGKPSKFRDYIKWMENETKTPEWKVRGEFWKDKLKNASNIQLPHDSLIDFQKQSGECGRYSFVLEDESYNDLKNLCVKECCTLYNLLFSCFRLFLHKISGKKDLVLGIPLAGQSLIGFKDLIGQCVSMVFICSSIDYNDGFVNFMKKTQFEVMECLQYQPYAYEELLNEVPNLCIPQIKVIFNMDRNISTPEFKGLVSEILPNAASYTEYELSMNVVDVDNKLHIYIDYNNSLFNFETIEVWAEYFKIIINSIIRNRHIKLLDVALQNNSSEKKIVKQSSGEILENKEESFKKIFENTIKKYGTFTALSISGISITYEELNGKVNNVIKIISDFTKDNTPLGLCFSYDLNALVSMIACLKIGKAFWVLTKKELYTNILDEKYVILTDKEDLKERRFIQIRYEKLEALAKAEINDIKEMKKLACVSSVNTECREWRHIGFSHKTMMNRFTHIIRELNLNPFSKVITKNGYIEDNRYEFILSSLLSGSCIEIVKELKKDAISDNNSIVLTSYKEWYQLSHFMKDINIENSIFVLLGIDLLYGHIKKFINSSFSNNKFILALQSGEFPFVLSLVNNADIDIKEEKRRVPLNNEFKANELEILDSTLKKTDITIPGKLYVSNVVSINDNESMNALSSSIERNEGNINLYPLKLNARRLLNGDIDIIQKNDNEEEPDFNYIKSIITLSDLVEDVFVIAGKGSKILVYIKIINNYNISLKDMKNNLKLILPEYIRKIELYIMYELKFDDEDNINLNYLKEKEGVINPSNKYEEELLNIWKTVLNIDNLSISDNFFELGGYSLQAMQLISKINDYYHLDVNLKVLIDAPTIIDFSNVIIEKIDKGIKNKNVSILPQMNPDCENWHKPFPLTDVQEAYWVGRSGIFELGNIATHTYFEFENSDLDLYRFERAWNLLIKRHGMLRVIILPSGEQMILENVPEYKVKVNYISNDSNVEEELMKTRNRMSHQIIQADKWPLFEICASVYGEKNIRIHFSIDALIMDTWSFQILLNEFSKFYMDLDLKLEPLEVSFRDYVMAEKELRKTDLYQKSLDYWMDRIKNMPPAPELPLAVSPSSLGKPEFIRVSEVIEADVWSRIKSKITSIGLTSSGLLLTAYVEAIGLWSKNQQFTINLTLFNPIFSHPQVNNLIGDFTSISLMTVDNTADNTFKERALLIQKQLWDDLEHRYVSGVKVMRELYQSKQGTAKVLMPIVFTSSLLTDESNEKDDFSQWMGELVYNIGQTPQVWLDHEVFERNGSLVLNWDHVKGLFPDHMIEDMFSTYVKILRSLADSDVMWYEDRKSFVGDILPKEHLNKIKKINNEEFKVEPLLLHEMFENSVIKYKNNIAIISGNAKLTYEEVENLSNKMSQVLRKYVKSSGVIAIIMEKGWQQIVAELSILKAGSAFLPIAADTPMERIRYILDNAEVNTIIIQEEYRDKYSEVGLRKILSFDDIDDQKSTLEPLGIKKNPEELAYIIYTSGSTGTPKGVMISHLGAVNTILDINERFNIDSNDKVLGISAFSFDLSIYDIFGMLAVGGAIVLPDNSRAKDPSYWLSLIEENKVTIWNSVPALAQMVVEYIEGKAEKERKFGSIRCVLMSGDWIPINLPNRIKKINGQTKAVSLGGATEASIWSIIYEIDKINTGWKSIPYGKPMKNQKIYILNEFMEICPTWVPGKIYISGIGLALGYLNDEEKTKEHFIIHPCTGERIYETGDYGRYYPDGNIEFLGRADSQVKIQGYRIELGEIEHIIMKHPAVNNCFVTTDSDENKQLKAFLVWNSKIVKQQNEIVQFNDPMERVRYKLKNPGIRNLRTEKSIQLAAPNLNKTYLEEKYIKRRSYRNFEKDLIDYEKFGDMVSCLKQVKIKGTVFPKYQYGSAGGIYPVQVYIFVKPNRIADISAGVYYYHPSKHELELINEFDDISNRVQMDKALYENSAFTIFLVSDMNAINPLYGKDSIRFATIEAGLISQMLDFNATSNGIGLCQAGNIDSDNIVKLINGGKNYLPLNCIFGGMIDEKKMQLEIYRNECKYYVDLVDEIKDKEVDGEALQEHCTSIDEVRPIYSYEDGINQLKEYLKNSLPNYMVPRIFVPLESMPLTSNGKVDKKALNEIITNKEIEVTLSKTDSVNEKNIEFELNIDNSNGNRCIRDKTITIVKDVLNKDSINPKANFFDIGASSIDLIRLNNRLNEEFDKKITIVELFENPNIESLVKYFSKNDTVTDITNLVELERINSGKNRLKVLKNKRGGKE